MYRIYLFICWVNSSGGYMNSELFEPFKLSVHSVHSKLSKHVKQVEHFESVRLPRGSNELVDYKN